MLNLKKYYGDHLLQIALVLSLLRIDYNSYLELNRVPGLEYQEIILGSSSAYLPIHHRFDSRLDGHAHPKSVESMILNQQSIFYELNSLGRYNPYQIRREITTYLLNDQERTSSEVGETNDDSQSSGTNEQRDETTLHSPAGGEDEIGAIVLTQGSTSDDGDPAADDDDSSALTKEDMDLIEVLLKQDIDLGVTRDVFDAQLKREVEKPSDSLNEKEDSSSSSSDNVPHNPWDGLNYTIDSETGEHVILPENEEPSISCEVNNSIASSLIEDDLFLTFPTEFETISLDNNIPLTDFEEAANLELKGSEPDSNRESQNIETSSADSLDLYSFLTENEDSLPELEGLEEMIQATQLYMQPHGRQLQGRMPYLRTISMEQRWQDLANILSLPIPSTEPDIHSSLSMVHGPPHNFGHAANSTYNNIDNCSTILLRNASLAPPLPDVTNNVSFHGDIIDTPNLATAVATSLSTLTNSSDPMGENSCHGNFTADGSALVYPHHNHSEINQTTDGFLSSILNDEDLQLMDMNMTENATYHHSPPDRYNQTQPISGMYPMRMLEHDDAMDTSSDSAVSSMDSSERLPSLPEGVNTCCHNEWIENGSDSTPDDHNRYFGLDYSQTPVPAKYRGYEYSAYASRQAMPPSNNSHDTPVLERPLQPVAQKKYQLFGKRYPPEQNLGGSLYNPGRIANVSIPPDSVKYSDYPFDRSQHDRSGRPPFEMSEGATAIDPPETKYSCSMEFARQHTGERGLMEQIQHNHTYQLPPDSMTSVQKPTIRDKHKKRIIDEHVTRDEKRARALKIPITTEEIVNLPMDEFNERLSKFDLTESQLALIRDIRRRGKNKVAAQNCRKRKLDQIVTLADEVNSLQTNKDDVMTHQQTLLSQRQHIKDKFTRLYRHVFQMLRDPDGNPYSLCEYSLQQVANGNVMLLPRNSSANLDLDPLTGAKAKKKDDTRK